MRRYMYVPPSERVRISRRRASWRLMMWGTLSSPVSPSHIAAAEQQYPALACIHTPTQRRLERVVPDAALRRAFLHTTRRRLVFLPIEDNGLHLYVQDTSQLPLLCALLFTSMPTCIRWAAGSLFIKLCMALHKMPLKRDTRW